MFCQVFGTQYRTQPNLTTAPKRPNLPSCLISRKTDPRSREYKTLPLGRHWRSKSQRSVGQKRREYVWTSKLLPYRTQPSRGKYQNDTNYRLNYRLRVSKRELVQCAPLRSPPPGGHVRQVDLVWQRSVIYSSQSARLISCEWRSLLIKCQRVPAHKRSSVTVIAPSLASRPRQSAKSVISHEDNAFRHFHRRW